jgi:molybdopterin-guanine dinucleotide biosynthesis protein A
MFTAAILAGGRATRFDGRDKSALVVGGPVKPDLPAGIRQVPNSVPGCGPLGGLHAALLAATGAATVVVACDMPYVSAPLLRYLLTAADGNSHAQGADIVVPKTERGYHPLCAVYTPACLEPAARRLADRRLKLTGLFDDVRVLVVTVESLTMFGDPDRLLTNVNTSIEYRAIEANGMQS